MNHKDIQITLNYIQSFRDKTMNLSEIKQGDFFKFLPDQDVHYLINTRGSDHANIYQTNHYTTFVVIKKNKVSILAKPVDGIVQYPFKFQGEVNNQKIKVVDPVIVQVENPPVNNFYQT